MSSGPSAAADLLGFGGRVAVVTGCASGIGRATAALLARLGAEVHGLDVATPPAGAAGSFHRLDLRDRDAIDEVADGLPRVVFALFNCAGIAPGPPGLDVVTVNYVGPRHLTDRLLARIEPGGAVVNVASNGGAGWRDRVPLLRSFVAVDGFDAARDWYAAHGEGLGAPYSFAKEAMIVWTLDLAARIAGRDLRANVTTPGAVQTPMLETIERMVPATAIDAMARPVGRRSTPEEQAWPLVFLGSGAARYVNGAVLPVDGGFMAVRDLAPADGRAPVGRR